MGAIGDTRLSTVVGYKIEKGNFNNVTPNLPQRVVILGQGNTANEDNSDFDENEQKEFTTLKQVGQRYGYGSPVYNMFRILRPISGTGLGGIPAVIIPQYAASGATTKQLNIESSGTASGNATHTLVVNGRRVIDGGRYDFVVAQGDGPTEISQKMVDTLNGVLSAPVTASQDTTETATESCLAETKWAGIDADELDISVDTNGNPVGVSYSVTDVQSGAGVPSTIQSALDTFGEQWNTIVLNPYGTNIHSTLENFNGKPDPNQPSGRYSGIVFKPFVALFGSTDSTASIDFSNQKDEVTNVVCPAPNAKTFNHEIAAAYGRVLAVQAQNNPHLDVQNMYVPDIPAAETAGQFGDYSFRDQKVKEGWSTAVIENGSYKIKDLVTTYHPDGEVPLQFSWVRNIMIDWNIAFRYRILEELYVVGHTLVSNNQKVDVAKVVKPKQWEATVKGLADSLSIDGLIAEPSFMKENISVSINDTNPDRFETTFKYKRSGFGRQSDTVVTAGFNLG